MPRPSQIDRQRKRLIPLVTELFSELGYRRTTTAELARRCEVRENILYRLWDDKKAMFVAAIDYLFEQRAEAWRKLLNDRRRRGSPAERLIAYEAKHQGEFGFYRIVFTALSETDDPEVQAALVQMYRRYHRLVCELIKEYRVEQSDESALPADAAAWALMGLATISNVCRHLELLEPRRRERMFAAVAEYLTTAAGA